MRHQLARALPKLVDPRVRAHRALVALLSFECQGGLFRRCRDSIPKGKNRISQLLRGGRASLGTNLGARSLARLSLLSCAAVLLAPLHLLSVPSSRLGTFLLVLTSLECRFALVQTRGERATRRQRREHRPKHCIVAGETFGCQARTRCVKFIFRCGIMGLPEGARSRGVKFSFVSVIRKKLRQSVSECFTWHTINLYT